MEGKIAFDRWREMMLGFSLDQLLRSRWSAVGARTDSGDEETVSDCGR